MTEAALQAEFENYLQLKNNPAKPALTVRNVGDIFFRHNFIKEEFATLHAMPAGTNANDLLVRRWRNEGHEKFMHDMTGNSVYAGDLELAPLAKFEEIVQ